MWSQIELCVIDYFLLFALFGYTKDTEWIHVIR